MRHEGPTGRPLGRDRRAPGIDTAGGATLGNVIVQPSYGATVAAVLH